MSSRPCISRPDVTRSRAVVSGRRARATWPGVAGALLFAMVAFAGRARAQAPDEALVKAAFVYNFLKFVDWPAAAFPKLDDPLVVAIVGDGATADAVERSLATRQVGDRRIVIRRQKWNQSLAGVHAVFVSEDDSKKLRQVLDAAADSGVLSIGEGEDFASRGGVIGLLMEGLRVRFDIDTGVADAARLRVSSKLLALGRVVRTARAGVVEGP